MLFVFRMARLFRGKKECLENALFVVKQHNRGTKSVILIERAKENLILTSRRSISWLGRHGPK